MSQNPPPPALNRWNFAFRPRLFDCLKHYNRERFLADIGAGTTVGIIALPLAIGLGIASGVSPSIGIFTAIIGGLLVSLLGGSKVQIGGPAGAFVGMVYAIIQEYGMPNLLICCMMAGAILFILGACRLGTLIKFIPHPVTTGFTCGIAITIATTQIKDFLGLQAANLPAEFHFKMLALAKALPSINPWAVAISVGSLAIILFWPRYGWRRIPSSIVAVLASTLLVRAFHLPVESISSLFGEIPRTLPAFHFPAISWDVLGHLVRPAVSIALLGGIESLLSAVVADGMVDDRHDSNQELMAQGAANLIAPLFGCIPVTGVIARTAANVRNGAATPVAGLVHAVFLLGVILLMAPLVAYIPMATLAAILLMVAYNMGEWEEFRILHRMAKSDAVVFLATFVLTVLFDLTVAVELGLLLAAFLFIKRVTDTTQVAAHDEEGLTGPAAADRSLKVPRGVLVYRVFGALLLGAADKLDTVMQRAGKDTKVVILHMAAVTALDGTALNALEGMHEKLRRNGKQLILSGPHTQPYFLMEKAGFLERIGEENIAADLDDAIARAKNLVDPKKRIGEL